MRKWISYIEKFVLFVPSMLKASISPDLVHIADHSDAIWALILPRNKTIVTCHDLIAVRAARGEIPEYHPGTFGRIYQSLVESGLRKAARIICVSHSTASDVRRLIQCQPVVIPNPISPGLETLMSKPRPSGTVGPASPFMLIVSSTGWRKNREAGVRAWVALQSTDAFHNSRLVVVGPPLTRNELSSIPPDLRENVRCLTAVPEKELATLYLESRALLFLTRYEGFGWPVIEAQLAGTPVLASDISPLREVGGEGCIYIANENLAEMTEQDWEVTAKHLTSTTFKEFVAQNPHRFKWSEFRDSLESIREDLLRYPDPSTRQRSRC